MILRIPVSQHYSMTAETKATFILVGETNSMTGRGASETTAEFAKSGQVMAHIFAKQLCQTTLNALIQELLRLKSNPASMSTEQIVGMYGVGGDKL